ncbi:hypothetical protein NGM33_28790 [Nocardiopsis dassonvillei]|uniref:hypothetical protein n=1 Tax=Nocardiopsis dassonvillei TaxID=2014 RepID=UPI0020A4F717|nr:hypothetical protein [Nocardiopsis dassonvillei]MCP3017335.1 hypothetical protein [Nocardiopsis dassonvillei]
MPRHITSDGSRFYIDGKPSTAIAAHMVLTQDEGMTDRDERIELLESIKAHPEETPR